MTQSMGDAVTVLNLPKGLDAYAGYVDGRYKNIDLLRATFPGAHILSISVTGQPADCADVETGAMTSWKGYKVGYCSVSSVNFLVGRDGRPEKLWTAHYTGIAHICSPVCWPGLVTTADGTQWTDHAGSWDESLLAADFFGSVPPGPLGQEGEPVYYILETTDTNHAFLVEFKLGALHKTYIPDPVALGAFGKTLVVEKWDSASAALIPSVGPGPTS